MAHIRQSSLCRPPGPPPPPANMSHIRQSRPEFDEFEPNLYRICTKFGEISEIWSGIEPGDLHCSCDRAIGDVVQNIHVPGLKITAQSCVVKIIGLKIATQSCVVKTIGLKITTQSCVVKTIGLKITAQSCVVKIIKSPALLVRSRDR